MKTQVVVVNRERINKSKILLAVKAIREGKVVVFPTETVYGVGCRHDDASARERIFALKGRDRSKPLGLYLLSAREIKNYSPVSAAGEKLAKEFLPGPLTLVLRGKSGGKVGFRVPSDQVCRRLIRLCGIPLAGTSANLSGRESPTDGQQAIAAMDGRADLIIDAGKTELRRDSTVIDLSGERPVVLREGAVAISELERVLGGEVGKAF